MGFLVSCFLLAAAIDESPSLYKLDKGYWKEHILCKYLLTTQLSLVFLEYIGVILVGICVWHQLGIKQIFVETNVSWRFDEIFGIFS